MQVYLTLSFVSALFLRSNLNTMPLKKVSAAARFVCVCLGCSFIVHLSFLSVPLRLRQQKNNLLTTKGAISGFITSIFTLNVLTELLARTRSHSRPSEFRILCHHLF